MITGLNTTVFRPLTSSTSNLLTSPFRAELRKSTPCNISHPTAMPPVTNPSPAYRRLISLAETSYIAQGASGTTQQSFHILVSISFCFIHVHLLPKSPNTTLSLAHDLHNTTPLDTRHQVQNSSEGKHLSQFEASCIHKIRPPFIT